MTQSWWFWLPVVVLASGQVVETWRHGSVFQDLRENCGRGLRSPHATIRFLSQLLLCGFCFSHWPPIVITNVVWWSLYCETRGWKSVGLVLALSLAVTRLSQLLNDFSHPWSRSPPREAIENEDLIEVPE